MHICIYICIYIYIECTVIHNYKDLHVRIPQDKNIDVLALSSIYPHRGKIVLNILCVHSNKSFSKVVPNPNLNICVFPYIIIFLLSPPPCQILRRRGQIEDYICIYSILSFPFRLETLTRRRGQMEDYYIGKDTYV